VIGPHPPPIQRHGGNACLAGAVDYAMIDLGTGQNWLTSRLFAVAIMRGMQALKTFVVVDSLGKIQDRFLGLVPPDTLRWAIAREYPWLERAYAAAYSSTISNQLIRSESGALDEVAAATLLQQFISSIQARQTGGAGEWVELGTQKWEHASWVSCALLERLVRYLRHPRRLSIRVISHPNKRRGLFSRERVRLSRSWTAAEGSRVSSIGRRSWRASLPPSSPSRQIENFRTAAARFSKRRSWSLPNDNANEASTGKMNFIAPYHF